MAKRANAPSQGIGLCTLSLYFLFELVKIVGDLAKLVGDLAIIVGDLAKIVGDLAKIVGDLELKHLAN